MTHTGHKIAALTLAGLLLAACGTTGLPGLKAKAKSAAAITASKADPACPNPIEPQRALEHVAFLTSRDLAGRMTASEGDYKADEYLMAQYRALGLTVTRQAFTSGAFRGTAHNVIAMLPGSEHPERFVVVGAHKDHLGQRGSKIYYGANDNAGGTAAVLEIARVMKEAADRGEGPKSSVLFMAFSGEELGLIGSAYYTKRPIIPTADGGAQPIKLSQVAGMVNLDCIAVGITDSLGTDAVSDRATRREVGAIAKKWGMQAVYKPFEVPHGAHEPDDHGHRPLPPGASSDHASFRRAGVRAICYYAEPVFSKYLHSPYDTIPERDEIEKQPEDQFNVSNLIRIAAVGLDTAMEWADE